MEACETMLGIAGQLTISISLLAAGCGVNEGVALPTPGDLSGIRRPASPNTCLAGPAKFVPSPDRSRVFGLPDIVLTQVLRAADGQSALVLYSYSLKGRYDFGVNRSRVIAVLTALEAALVRQR